MAIVIIEHEKDCPPGLLGRPDLSAQTVRPYLGDPVPGVTADLDGLIVLGGEMGANDDERYGWLTPTKRLIADATAAGVPTFLICLGHQLGAVALGGRVDRSPQGSMWGVVPVGFTPAGREDPLLGRLPAHASTVHWNGDLVTDLPEGAVVLAHDPRGGVQAVRYAPRTWGVQCHPEVDVEIVSRWSASQSEAKKPGSEASARRALDEVRSHIEEIHAAWRPVLAAFVELATS